MTFRGRVKNGVVVFDGTAPLAEGTVVDVQPRRDPSEPERGSAAAIMRHAGTWAGTAEEMDRLLEELREMKWAEVKERQQRGDDDVSF